MAQETAAAPVKFPDLVKTSDQALFTTSESLRVSDIIAVPSLNLHPNSYGGIIKKISSSYDKNFVKEC
jgi:hypothetical protein